MQLTGAEPPAKEQVSPVLLEKSLPHRTDGERADIAQGFLGVTTWQRVCREFGLPWPPPITGGDA